MAKYLPFTPPASSTHYTYNPKNYSYTFYKKKGEKVFKLTGEEWCIDLNPPKRKLYIINLREQHKETQL